ncbi:response regulator [Clostridium argentinense CDC 2741]|uniref:Stage 0 sporulation protein A homolog n=1 Tax=Clostridium argentinense CDC 2741 TaxID=1418104 RepID=A0A0C1U0B7_9CLOT|nr:response regulator [Clostridium argentinense]ARC84306.1 response regulator [Clostridium argentinense]KIE44958.1 response regulator [Clostridium argentinense CDC 2741]NFF38269.1 response regulator [Clostridium argentinense]NFP49146.1 response regulator [Clostridium argentinense]NFP71574.1 response regulator [Clostridium argentinense]
MKRVLIIDDTKNIRTLLTTCLELRDYEVLTAENGRVALDILKEKKEKIDLIFLDIRMPGMSGTEVLKSLRSYGISCPVIIMTAFATVKNAVDCTKLGAVAYLQKPFSPDRVNTILDEITENTSSENITNSNLKDVELYLSKAKSLINEKKYDEAFENIKTTLSINPYIKETYYLIGQINENTDNSIQAKRFYDIAKLFD